ncbi:MAG: hypothetical protein M3Y41_17225, partial [Pseudomonadota bacterium]|nr:hypothetical protein [Pseudomonadota bacterium]
MIKVRDYAAVLAIGALATLPGCSLFGGGNKEAMAPAATAAPPPPAAPAPAAPPMTAGGGEQNQMDHSLVRQVQTKLKSGHMYR